MVFKANIPQPNDDLDNVSQPDLLGNMQQLDVSFGVNHYAFSNLTANNGKHHSVVMPTRALNSVPTIAGEGALYTSTINSVSALVYTKDGNADVVLTGPFNIISNGGFTFLPGGLLLQWGVNTVSSGGTTNFGFSYQVAGVPTNPYNVQVTIFQNTTNRHFAYVQTLSPTSFTTTNLDAGGSGESNTFFWSAIGPFT